jgi:general stress protein YciG
MLRHRHGAANGSRVGAFSLSFLEEITMAGKQRRGFAAMDEEQQREIARKGGRAAHELGKAHEWDEAEAREAGRKGGAAVSRDRGHMAEIGRKGGLAAHHHR